MSDELAPRSNFYTWELLISFFFAATVMDPHGGNTIFLTQVLEHDTAHLPCCTPPTILLLLLSHLIMIHSLLGLTHL